MIIEIKDLGGREVKKITFDIEFEDGKVQSENKYFTPTSSTEPPKGTISTPKPIPNEMSNGEF